MRLISICPSNTELAVYLGLKEQLVALDDFSDWPLDLSHLPRLGPDLSINMDRLESYHPDLVLASLSVPGMEKNIEELEKRKIPHIVFNPQSFQDISNDLHTLSRLTGKQKEAEDVIKNFQATLQTYKEISDEIQNPPSIFFEWWPNPIFSPGQINWLTELSRLAGARNIFEDIELASVQTTWDDVLNRDPEYFCLCWVGVKQSRMKLSHVLKRERAQTLQAVQKNQLHLLEESLFCRPSPRLILGLQKLAYLLHPDIYPRPN